MHVKSAPLEIVEADGLGDGEFKAYASTFTTKDSYGDVMHRNAFDADNERWNSRSDAVQPLLWNHDTKDPKNNIGEIITRSSDDHGWLVHGKFDLDTSTGAHVHRLVKGRRVTMLSFAYDEQDSQPIKADPKFGDHLLVKQVLTHEVSVTPYGANRDTTFLGVKAACDALVGDTTGLDADTRAMLHDALVKAASALQSSDSTATRKAQPSGTPGHGDSRTVDELARKYELAGLSFAGELDLSAFIN